MIGYMHMVWQKVKTRNNVCITLSLWQQCSSVVRKATGVRLVVNWPQFN